MDTMLNTSIFVAVTVLLVVYLCIKLAISINQFIRKSSLLKKFPHEPPHWFWGHLQIIPKVQNEEGLAFQREMANKFTDVSLAWFGPFLPALILTSPLSVKPILKTADPKSKIYGILRSWLGDGLLLSSGDKWARNRRLLTPAFHFDILKPYLTIKNKAADVFCTKLSEFAKSGKYFEECFLVAMFTLDVILKCAFSYDAQCQEIGINHPYVMAVNQLGKIASKRFLKPLLHIDWIFFLTKDGRDFKKHCNFVHGVAEEIILKRRKVLEQQLTDVTSSSLKTKCTDFLDILLMARDEDHSGLSDKEIRDEVDTFLFEGHDTTASAISWTLYSIAQHGKIQDRLQKEIDGLLDGRASDDIQASDLNQLPYLSMCIKESLRLHCVVGVISRESNQTFEINGKLVPKGTMTNIMIYGIHHNLTLWDDSLEFRPERFSAENIDKINAFAYIPFSAGPRNCIGQNFAMHEIKVLVVKVLRRFYLDIDPGHTVRKIEELVMKAEHGIKLKATYRLPGEYRFD